MRKLAGYRSIVKKVAMDMRVILKYLPILAVLTVLAGCGVEISFRNAAETENCAERTFTIRVWSAQPGCSDHGYKIGTVECDCGQAADVKVIVRN